MKLTWNYKMCETYIVKYKDEKTPRCEVLVTP